MHLELALAADDRRHCRRLPFYAPSTSVDNFDRLPDSLLLIIFNKLGDIRTLGRCCAVSKRFCVLAPQAGNVVVKVDCVISGEESSINVKGRGVLSHFARFVYGSIVKPFQALQHMLGPKKAKPAEISHHSPGEVLKNFKEVQNLRIELPGGELGIEEGFLLKWKAEFGSTLESCVILGASSVAKVDIEGQGVCSVSRGKEAYVQAQSGGACEFTESNETESSNSQVDNGSIPESFYTDGSLKLRVVWTISSLIAASARHYLLQQIISDHSTLESLVLTDADGQGTLRMGKDQLQEFRDKPLAASASANRTQVPALNMKLWYAPHLELPDGTGLKGATLVAIRPSERTQGKETEEYVSGEFEEPYKTAAAMLAKRRTYVLEMNSF
ncbi:hypothetical protein O6H91_14G005000 [Diphasiastrum complanatum]|uniref:Uncharacterized protein n=1 Tax=Diphasiastrum complanatum TaxID=34168 RepID=A0ACC2BL43_DIPCM|nr:hypothetical protein O6H91_14G005000 [Diphasiastrum complanatum]